MPGISMPSRLVLDKSAFTHHYGGKPAPRGGDMFELSAGRIEQVVPAGVGVRIRIHEDALRGSVPKSKTLTLPGSALSIIA